MFYEKSSIPPGTITKRLTMPPHPHLHNASQPRACRPLARDTPLNGVFALGGTHHGWEPGISLHCHQGPTSGINTPDSITNGQEENEKALIMRYFSLAFPNSIQRLFRTCNWESRALGPLLFPSCCCTEPSAGGGHVCKTVPWFTWYTPISD